MGVARDGVTYVSTVTWQRRLVAPVAPDVLQLAVGEAESVARREASGPVGPVAMEPVIDEQGAGIVVSVVLERSEHAVRPVFHMTRADRPRARDGALGIERGEPAEADRG